MRSASELSCRLAITAGSADRYCWLRRKTVQSQTPHAAKARPLSAHKGATFTSTNISRPVPASLTAFKVPLTCGLTTRRWSAGTGSHSISTEELFRVNLNVRSQKRLKATLHKAGDSRVSDPPTVKQRGSTARPLVRPKRANKSLERKSCVTSDAAPVQA